MIEIVHHLEIPTLIVEDYLLLSSKKGQSQRRGCPRFE